MNGGNRRILLRYFGLSLTNRRRSPAAAAPTNLALAHPFLLLRKLWIWPPFPTTRFWTRRANRKTKSNSCSLSPGQAGSSQSFLHFSPSPIDWQKSFWKKKGKQAQNEKELVDLPVVIKAKRVASHQEATRSCVWLQQNKLCSKSFSVYLDCPWAKEGERKRKKNPWPEVSNVN